MDRNPHILRRDARAPLCVAPNPLWMFEEAFEEVLARHLGVLERPDRDGVRWMAQHHYEAQEFVVTVDDLIVDERPAGERVRLSLATLLGIARGLAALADGVAAVDRLRERLDERMEEEAEGRLPEFEWDKRAGGLYVSRIEGAGVPRDLARGDLFVCLSDVYDDCAQTLQFGYWVLGNAERVEVVDDWLFQSSFAFSHHILPHHILDAGGGPGLLSVIPRILERMPVH